jgi:hypothetical protein
MVDPILLPKVFILVYSSSFFKELMDTDLRIFFMNNQSKDLIYTYNHAMTYYYGWPTVAIRFPPFYFNFRSWVNSEVANSITDNQICPFLLNPTKSPLKKNLPVQFFIFIFDNKNAFSLTYFSFVLRKKIYLHKWMR